MITKTGEMLVKTGKCFKTAAIDPVFRNALNAAAEHVWKKTDAVRKSAKGQKEFTDILSKNLKWGIDGKHKHLFHMGDINGQHVYGNLDRIEHIAESRVGQTIEHGNGVWQDLTQEQLDKMFTDMFATNKDKLLKGVSFRTEDFYKLRDTLGESPSRRDILLHFNKKVYPPHLQRYFKEEIPFDKQVEVARKLHKYRMDHGERMYLENQYGTVGFDDMWTQHAGGVGDVKPVMFTHPTDPKLFSDLENSNFFTTMYTKRKDDIMQDVRQGRILNLFDKNGNPYR